MNLAGHRDRRLSENYFEPCIHQGCHQEVGARYFPSYFHRKIEEKISSEIPSYLIPRLLVVPSRQLKILVTALYSYMFCEEDL